MHLSLLIFTFSLTCSFALVIPLDKNNQQDFQNYYNWPLVSFQYFEKRHVVDFPVVIVYKNASLPELKLTDKWLGKNFVYPIYHFETSRLNSKDLCKLLNSNPYLLRGFNLISFYESIPLVMNSISTCLDFPLTSFLSWSHLNASSVIHRKKYFLPYINNFISIWTKDEKDTHKACQVQTLDFDACGFGFIAPSGCIQELANFSLKFLV